MFFHHPPFPASPGPFRVSRTVSLEEGGSVSSSCPTRGSARHSIPHRAFRDASTRLEGVLGSLHAAPGDLWRQERFPGAFQPHRGPRSRPCESTWHEPRWRTREKAHVARRKTCKTVLVWRKERDRRRRWTLGRGACTNSRGRTSDEPRKKKAKRSTGRSERRLKLPSAGKRILERQARSPAARWNGLVHRTASERWKREERRRQRGPSRTNTHYTLGCWWTRFEKTRG